MGGGGGGIQPAQRACSHGLPGLVAATTIHPLQGRGPSRGMHSYDNALGQGLTKGAPLTRNTLTLAAVAIGGVGSTMNVGEKA